MEEQLHQMDLTDDLKIPSPRDFCASP